MKQYQIKRRIMLAIDNLRLNDNHLLKHNCSERSICHRLALYLESTFGKDFNVDCEYNRNGYDPKRLDFSLPPARNSGRWVCFKFRVFSKMDAIGYRFLEEG